MQDDAFRLQLQEAGGNAALFASAPDPQKAKAMLVGLCFYRFDVAYQHDFKKSINFYMQQQRYLPLVQFFYIIMEAILSSPEEYPFSLSEREVAMFSKQNFGDEIKNLDGIYKPPSFYNALADDIAKSFITVGIAAVAVAALPEAAASAAVGGTLSPVLARGVLSSLGGTAAGELLPGGAFDAAKKNRLWRRYELEYARRSLK